jgi:hypothetical protein
MTRKKPEFPEGDDGRTIADMNVEGMPWYNPGERLSRGERKQKAREEAPLTKQESRYYTWGALKAALLVTGVMCAGIALFVLFCLHVWFR